MLTSNNQHNGKKTLHSSIQLYNFYFFISNLYFWCDLDTWSL